MRLSQWRSVYWKKLNIVKNRDLEVNNVEKSCRSYNINIILSGIFKKIKDKGERIMRAVEKEFTVQEVIEINKRNEIMKSVTKMLILDRKNYQTPQQIFYVNFKTSKLEHLVELEDIRLGNF